VCAAVSAVSGGGGGGDSYVVKLEILAPEAILVVEGYAHCSDIECIEGWLHRCGAAEGESEHVSVLRTARTTGAHSHRHRRATKPLTCAIIRSSCRQFDCDALLVALELLANIRVTSDIRYARCRTTECLLRILRSCSLGCGEGREKGGGGSDRRA
jgi:hypothetical protein